MAEVLVEFSEAVAGTDGITYTARACGAESDHGQWEGWVEFVPVGGGDTIRSGRETTQPNRIDTVYWATGLTPIYLEGALERALKPAVHHIPRAASILNPFSAARHGEAFLRRQLGALSGRHLINIIAAHELSAQPIEDLQQFTPPQLIELIVAGVFADVDALTAK